MKSVAEAACLRGLDPQTARAPGARSRRFAAGLVLLLAAHLGLRLWYAGQGLHAGRFWDENVNVDNARALLASGRFAPANGFYPTLAYLPEVLAIRAAARIAERVTGEEVRVFTAGRMHPRAYFTARAVCALWGVGAVALTFVIGRRLFSPQVGFVAAALFAASPWHVHVSGYWKPDALIVFALLAVLLAAVGLVERPDLPRHLLAGAAIGLAVSGKFTAAFTPLLVVVAAALAWRRARSPLLHLALAALSSLLVFVFLNPQIALFFRDFGWTMRDYARHAVWEGTTRGEAIVGSLAFPAERFANGAAAAALAALGLAVVVALAASRRQPPLRRARWAVLLSFPLLFLVAYNLGTPRLKANNLVPLLPISSLLAAIPLCLAWEAAGRRLPRLRRGGAAWLAAAALVAATAPRPFLYVYRLRTPTTEDVALLGASRALRLRQASRPPRIVFFERTAPRGIAWEGRRRYGNRHSALVPVDRLRDVAPARLDRADGEIFRADRLHGPDAAFYRARLERPGAAGPERIAPSPFRRRGPELVALWRPWPADGVAARLRLAADGAARSVELPAAPEPGALYSLALQLPRGLQRHPVAVRLGGLRLALSRSSNLDRRRGHTHLSERFAPAAEASGTQPIAVEVAGGRGEPVELVVWRWSPHAAGKAP